jgi:hypothetical protein
VAAVVVSALAACGGSSSGGTGASAASTSPAATNQLHVTITDGGYRIEGNPRPGRIDIVVVNQSSEAGEFSFQPLKPGVTVAKLVSVLKHKGEGAANNLLSGDSDSGGYGEPAIIGAGMTAETITTAAVPAGDYVAASFLPGPHGVPQALQGRIGGFTISGPKFDAVPASVGGTIELTDHAITLPAGFDGHGTYAVTNRGSRAHDVSFARLEPAATLPQLFKCVGASFGKNAPIDRCPGVLAGGVDAINPGDTAYVAFDFAGGNYGYVSTAGNDVAAGLAGTVTIS